DRLARIEPAHGARLRTGERRHVRADTRDARPTEAASAAVGVLGAGHAGRAHQVVRAARVAAGVPGTRVPVVALGVVVTAGRWGDGPVHAVAELGVADVVGAGVLVGRASVYRRWALLLCIAACAAGIAGPGLPLELGTLTAAAARDARGGRVGTLVDLSVAALLHAVLVGAVLIDGAAVGLVLVRADAFRQARVGRARVRVVARGPRGDRVVQAPVHAVAGARRAGVAGLAGRASGLAVVGRSEGRGVGGEAAPAC